jgi:hypothetical protein
MNTQQLQYNKSNVYDMVLDNATVIQKTAVSNEALSQKQKQFIDEALLSIESEGVLTHNSVMMETKNRYPHLYNR